MWPSSRSTWTAASIAHRNGPRRRQSATQHGLCAWEIGLGSTDRNFTSIADWPASAFRYALAPVASLFLMASMPQTLEAALQRPAPHVKAIGTEHLPQEANYPQLAPALEVAIGRASERHGVAPSILRAFA